MIESEVELSTLPLYKGGLFGVIADLVAPSPCLVSSVGLRLFVEDDLTELLLRFLLIGLLFDIIKSICCRFFSIKLLRRIVTDRSH